MPAIDRSVRRAVALCWAALVSATAACGPADDALVSGTIEVTQTDVASLTPARVLRIRVDEGDSVRAGDTLVLLTQSAMPADLDQRQARVAAAESELRDLVAGARPAELERAESEARSAAVDADRATRDAERLSSLAGAGQVSQQQMENARSAAQVAANRRSASERTLQLLRDGARPDRVRAARAALAAARSQLAMGEAAASDLILRAPVGGVVIGRYAEAGEVIGAGVPIVAIGDGAHPWVRVYVDAPTAATLRPGDRAEVILMGSVPAIPARVASISTRAEFTPRVALTERERADLLFGVRLTVEDSTGRAKAGLPVTVRFLPATRGEG